MIRDIADTIVRRVLEQADPVRIYVFGSAARGEARPDSDLDILVVEDGEFGRDRPRWRELSKIRRGLADIEGPKDVLPYGIGMSSSQVRLSDAGTFSANSLLVLTLSGGDRLTIVAYGASQFGSVGSKPRSTVESAPKSCRRPFGVPGKLSLLSSSRCCGSRRWFCCLPLPV